MGAIGGPLGLNGGAAGSGFAAPGQANVQQAVSTSDAINSYNQNNFNQQQQQGLLNALSQQNGIGNQSSVFNQLQNVASGQGPNPAQAMLNQATGANVANQAALAAGQRGAGANVGLMARQAAMQGANTQQQAVGQGATMQANQSLGALGQMGGIAGQQVTNQVGQTNAITSANQQEQANLLNAIAGVNQARVGSQGSVNAGNTNLAEQEMRQGQSAAGGSMQGAGSAMMAAMAGGGSVTDGGEFQNGPQSEFGKFMSTNQTKMAAGGGVPVKLSPGEKVVEPQNVQKAAAGKVISKTVPGKAKVSGDSLKNDTFDTKAKEGSIVIPRTKAKDDKNSAEFVRKTLAKRRNR